MVDELSDLRAKRIMLEGEAKKQRAIMKERGRIGKANKIISESKQQKYTNIKKFGSRLARGISSIGTTIGDMGNKIEKGTKPRKRKKNDDFGFPNMPKFKMPKF